MPTRPLPTLTHPKSYDFLLELRKSTTAKLRATPKIQDWVRFRYYQVIGIMHILKMSRMVLGDGTGLGKTVELIGAYVYLLEKYPDLKLLVVAPKSATAQWVDEFNRFTYGVHTQRLENFGKASRLKQYKEFWGDPKRNVLVMHYHFFREDIRLYERLYVGRRFMLVLDEATAVKNHQAKVHKIAKQVSGAASRSYGLTATLLKNNLLEGFGIYKVIYAPLFKNITSFKDWYCVQKKRKIGSRNIPMVVGYKNIDHFRSMIDPYFVGRNKYDVSDELPELITKEIRCGLTGTQASLYADALNGLLEVGGEEKETSLLSQLAYCQQIVNDPELIGHTGVKSDKKDEFHRLLEEELIGEKVIVFSRFKKMINILQHELHEKGYETTRITGDETEEQRNVNKLMFQEDMEGIRRWANDRLGPDADPRVRNKVTRECKYQLLKIQRRRFPQIMLLTPAGSEAINLQRASAFIFYDTPWSPGDYDQLLGRMIRIGSEHETVVAIHLMCKGTIDDHVMQVIKAKARIIKKVLGEQTKGALQFDKESDIREIFMQLRRDAREGRVPKD